jgi:hypothetical protein
MAAHKLALSGCKQTEAIPEEKNDPARPEQSTVLQVSGRIIRLQ